MFNNINENNRDFLYDSQAKTANIVNLAQVRSSFQKSGYANNPYVDKTEISASAMQLFQRDLDVNKFTKLAISDPDDKSYISQVQDLFKDGVVDVWEDDVIADLVNSSKLWNDLRAE